ncbi:MAG: beta-galactosidase [Armatimonadota bacterium]
MVLGYGRAMLVILAAVAAALCLEGAAMAEGRTTLYGFETEGELGAIAQANDASLGLALTSENARQGGRALEVTLGQRGEGGDRIRAIRLPNPGGCDWSGYGALCLDVFNPQDELFAIDLDIADGDSRGYHRGYWDQRWSLAPGWNEIVIGLGDGFRHGEYKEAPMNLKDMRAIELTVKPLMAGERKLYLDNVRLEAAGDEAAAVATNQAAVAAFWAGRKAMPERAQAERAASALAAEIEAARQGGMDTIYPEALLFVARLGLDLRSGLAWFSSIEQQREIYAYVMDACGRASAEIREVRAGDRAPRTLVRHSPQELELRGAYWYAGDDPVLVTAMLYNNEGPLMRFFHPHDVVPCLLTTAGASRYDVERTPLYEAFKRYPETHRVGYDGWCGHLIRDKWSMGGGNEEVVICLESPYMKHAMAEAIKAKTPHPGELPNMLVHVMEGELSYCCYCEYTQEMFRQWLIERHGSIEQINAVWGTDYKSIAEVRTPHHENWDGNRARWYDFADFNQQRFTKHHIWAKSQVRQVDPVTPATVGGIYYAFSARQGLLGVDNEAWVDEMCEAAEAEAGGQGTMPTDFLWAVCDGRKPVIDLEYHSDIFSWWGHFLHGYAILAMWYWPGPEASDMLETSVPHSPNIALTEVEKLLMNALDIQRLSGEIIQFPQARSPFAILYSRSSLLQAPPDAERTAPYTAELERLYNATRSLDAGRTFVTERDLGQGQADRFRIIALPSVRYLAPEAFGELKAFAERGGTLLVLGDSLRADQYARPAGYLEQVGLDVSGSLGEVGPAEDTPERQPFGPGEAGWQPRLDTEAYHFDPANPAVLVGQAGRLAVEPLARAEVLARFEDGQPGVVRLPLGQGRVYYVPAPLGEESLLALTERLLDEAGVRPIAAVRELDGTRPSDIEARSVEHDGAVLLYVINPRQEAVTLRVESERAFTQVENLRTGHVRGRGAVPGEAGDSPLSVTVPARDTGLFRLVGR